MMLTTKARYAVTAMLNIAYFSKNNKSIQLCNILAKQQIVSLDNICQSIEL